MRVQDLVEGIWDWAWKYDLHYHGCLPELIMCSVCECYGKPLRHQVVCQAREQTPDGSWRSVRHGDQSGKTVPRPQAEWRNFIQHPLSRMGPPLLLRATQALFHPEQVSMRRINVEITLYHLKFCHSLTHATSVSRVMDILRYGRVPGDRLVMLAPFMQGDRERHVESSRDGDSAFIRFNMGAGRL